MKFEDAVKAAFEEFEGNSRIVNVDVSGNWATLEIRPQSKKMTYSAHLIYHEDTGEYNLNCPYNTSDAYKFAYDVIERMKEN